MAHRNLGIYCLGAGWQEGLAAPTRHRVLDSYAAVLVLAGSGRLESSGCRAASLHSPVLFWLFPGVQHTYAPDQHGWSEQWVLFDGFGARSYEHLGLLNRTHPVVELAQQPADHSEVTRLFTAITDRCLDNGATAHVDVEAAALVHQLIVTAARSARHPWTEGRDHELIDALRADACSPLSVSEHARRLGVSVRTLRDAARRDVGSTPKEILVEARVSRAKELLAHTDRLVSQISHEVGYDDPAYFCRIFSRLVGSSPTSFRQRQTRAVP